MVTYQSGLSCRFKAREDCTDSILCFFHFALIINGKTLFIQEFITRTAFNVNISSENRGGGVFPRIFGGVFHPVLEILTLFQTKACYFPHQLSDPAS